MNGPLLAFLLLAANGGTPEVEAIRACWADAVDAGACVGLTVQDCVASSPGGETTVGMVDCIGAETAAWDLLLNEEYQATMTAGRAMDATGDVVSPEMTREATLRTAQRAWIAFRDAHCTAEYARWGMGSMRQVVGANCLMGVTAERAIALRSMREP